MTRRLLLDVALPLMALLFTLCTTGPLRIWTLNRGPTRGTHYLVPHALPNFGAVGGHGRPIPR